MTWNDTISQRIQEREKAIKLINKIFSNLISNENEEKYKDLNFLKISTKLPTCCITLLLIAGFVISPNNERLYFDDEKRNALLDTNKLLQSKLSHAQNESNHNKPKRSMKEEKSDDEDEKEEKKYADDDNAQHQSKESVLSYLMNFGYEQAEVMEALDAANNDTNVALEILIQVNVFMHDALDRNLTISILKGNDS